jgi:hypothetical protein
MNTMKTEEMKIAAREYKASTPETAWFRLESRLEKHRSQKKIRLYKYFSYAAVMVTIFGMVSVFSYSINTNSDATLTSDYVPFSLSDLDQKQEQGIYDIAQLHTLKAAYQKMGSNVEM